MGNWLKEKKAFRLVTTCDRTSACEFDRIPREHFVYADDILRLYAQYRKGATPKARPLQLSVEDKLCYRDPHRSMVSYLFNARVADFRKYLESNDVARLVARNIRYNLGGRIGRDIRNTYERYPRSFWYVHNGLTIICDDFIEKDQVATLTNPSVVNGAQTLYAIGGSSRKSSPALVTTRVIVRGDAGTEAGCAIEDDEWLQKIIRGVNTQNRVRGHDFRSNEPEQIELQNRFREQKVFYERKRGEWREYRNEPRYRNFDRVSLKDLAFALASVSDKSGDGVLLVKRGSEHVFDEKHYRKLFPSRTKVGRRFARFYLTFRLYRLLLRRGYASRREWRKQRHAFWNTLWILYLGINSLDEARGMTAIRRIHDVFDEFEGIGRWGRRAGKILKNVSSTVWRTWGSARTVAPEKWTANNFFKSKFGNRRILQVAFPKVRQALRELASYIAQQ